MIEIKDKKTVLDVQPVQGFVPRNVSRCNRMKKDFCTRLSIRVDV